MTAVNAHDQPIGDPVDWSPRRPPTRVALEGRYVLIEPVGKQHTAALWKCLCGRQDRSLWTYRPDDPPADLPSMRRRVAQWAASGNLTYALVPVTTGRAAGVTSFYRIDLDHGSIESGAVLFSRALQRTREATEVMALMGRYVFDELGYRRLEWKLDSHNAPSFAAAQRLGFRYEGRFRNAMVYKGRNRDTDWFAMTDDEWRLLSPAFDGWLESDNFGAEGRQLRPLSSFMGTSEACNGTP